MIPMFRGALAFLLLGIILAPGAPAARAQDADLPDVRIAGTISTKPLLTGLVKAMKQANGIKVAVSADLTSMDAADALAQGKVDIAIITRTLTGEDRAEYPAIDFFTTPVGMEVVALGVSDDVWQAGVHSVSKETMRNIYEQKITNWKDLGGPDEKITYFNPLQGLGVWEILTEWLYGDNRKAPLPKVEHPASSEEARDDLEFTPGAIAPLAAPFADGTRCHALGVDLQTKVAAPTAADVAASAYPVVRPILAMTVGKPALVTRTVTEYLTGPEGQALVKKCGGLGTEAVPKPTPDPYLQN
jgi:phosphate transport system substrate-binding protein